MLSEDNNDNILRDDDGAYQPQQPLTFEKVWLMFQETGKMMKEQSRETDRKFRETREEIRETSRSVKSLSKNIGGIGNNLGEIAEEYFRGAFSNLPEVAGIKIKKVDSMERRVGKLTGQFDIVLLGDNANVVVEVKHKLQQKDVVRFFNKTLPSFKQLYPEHCELKVFAGVAGMAIDDEALTQAIDLGLLVFTQSGQEIHLLNPEGFEPAAF